MKTNPVESFALSKKGQKFYKWICADDKQKFLNNTLPTLESAVATMSYLISTEMQPNIPREQKNLLNWQTLGSGIIGMCLGSFLNKKATNLVDKIAPKIDKNIVDVHKVKTGLAIGIPALTTCLIMRFALPLVTAQLSSEIEERRRKKKLDKIV